MTERLWKFAEEANLPRFVVVNQMDHPKAGGGAGLSALIETCSSAGAATVFRCSCRSRMPQGFHGVVDLVTMQAFLY